MEGVLVGPSAGDSVGSSCCVVSAAFEQVGATKGVGLLCVEVGVSRVST